MLAMLGLEENDVTNVMSKFKDVATMTMGKLLQVLRLLYSDKNLSTSPKERVEHQSSVSPLVWLEMKKLVYSEGKNIGRTVSEKKKTTPMMHLTTPKKDWSPPPLQTGN